MQIASIAFSLIILLSGVAFNGVKEISYRSEPKPSQTAMPIVAGRQVLAVIDNSFIYPNSKIISQTESETVLESTDDVEVVTSWYQQKIKEGGFNIKNFVKTKVNGKVENKLSGVSNETKIDIDITKSEDSSVTRIIIH